MKYISIVLLVAVLLVATVVGGCYEEIENGAVPDETTPQETSSGPPAPGKKAPGFELPDLEPLLYEALLISERLDEYPL